MPTAPVPASRISSSRAAFRPLRHTNGCRPPAAGLSVRSLQSASETFDGSTVDHSRRSWLGITDSKHRLVVLVMSIGCILPGLCCGESAGAAEVRLDNEMVFEGTPVPVMGMNERTIQQARGPVPNYPIMMVDTGMKWYFLAGRHVVESPTKNAVLDKYETFKIEQHKTGRSLTPTSLGTFIAPEPFNEHGRRTVTIKTDRGPVSILQGITQLTPRHVRVEGLSHVWEHGLATTSIPSPILDTVIKSAIDQNDPLERLAVARFYLQAGLYLESEQELRQIIEEFPDYRDRVQIMFEQLQELIATRFLRELDLRQRAGQHRLVLVKAHEFPAGQLSASVQQRVADLMQAHRDRSNRLESALLLLSQLHAKLEDPQLIEATAAMRSIVRDRVDFEALPRLDAFLNLAEAPDLTASQKLALAYSGWILGSSNAIDDLAEVVRLWQVRFLIREYLLAADPAPRRQLLAEISGTEGISIERVQAILQHLPPTASADEAVPGGPRTIELPFESRGQPIRYSVMLPTEYSPNHRYPLILALHAEQQPPAGQLVWWGGNAEHPGQSQRRGYIVIAPHYMPENQSAYDYDVDAHRVVIESLRDARRRYSVDSDRVFLAGHGMGGDAAFDIGMSHPDMFAGVIPICGLADRYCSWYWPNCENLPLFIVGGELDGDWFDHNAQLGHVNRMLKYGYEVICTVYQGRGRELYYEEIHTLFDWMDRNQRHRFGSEIEARTIRPTDNHFDWIQVDGLPPAVLRSGVLTGDRRMKTAPMVVSARVTPGNTISVTSGAQQHTLWLSPEFVDFEQRVTVRHRGRQKFNDFPRPSIEDMLEDFRVRHDREKLFWQRITF